MKRLLHSTNIEDALALLLTKVGSEFLVLMNLTSRGKKYLHFSRILFTMGNVDQDIGRYSGRQSVDSQSTVGRQSVDTRSI